MVLQITPYPLRIIAQHIILFILNLITRYVFFHFLSLIAWHVALPFPPGDAAESHSHISPLALPTSPSACTRLPSVVCPTANPNTPTWFTWCTAFVGWVYIVSLSFFKSITRYVFFFPFLSLIAQPDATSLTPLSHPPLAPSPL